MATPVRDLQGSTGALEALLDEPVVTARAAVVLAHPHPQMGGTMHTKTVYYAAKAFSRIGCAVLRFNFGGTARGDSSPGSDGRHDGEHAKRMDEFRAALEFIHQRYPSAPLWAGGVSFGAWIALTKGAADPRVSALVGIAPPLPYYDFAAVQRSATAKFFIQGERDEICPLRQMREFYARCEEPKELVVVDAADHVFDGKVTEVGDAIEDLLGDWNG